MAVVARSYGHTLDEWDTALGRFARQVARNTGNELVAYAPSDREATQFTFRCPQCKARWSGTADWHWDNDRVVNTVYAIAEQHTACALDLGPAGRTP